MRLMLAIDIDDHNPVRLLNEGILWAQRLGATMDLAHVTRDVWQTVAGTAPEIQLLLERELTRSREVERARLLQLIERVPIERRGTVHQLTGSPVEALVEASRDHALLVVGTHGREGLARIWLGSVSEQIVRRAVCPVLVVRLYQDG